MSRSSLVAGILTVVLGCVGNASAIDGPPVPFPGDPAYDNDPLVRATEAVCAVGYTPWMRGDFDCFAHWAGEDHRNTGSGYLIAPNLVVTAAHVLEGGNGVPLGQCDPGTVSCNGVTKSKWSVRFRLNPDGSYGALDPSDPGGGWDTFYQVEVKRVIWPTPTVQGGGSGAFDSVLLVLADGPDDTAWADGWIEHIEPLRVFQVPPTHSGESPDNMLPVETLIAGWGRSDPNVDDRGVLRYAVGTSGYSQLSGGAWVINGYGQALLNDSGGAVLGYTDCGEVVLVGGISQARPTELLQSGVLFNEYTGTTYDCDGVPPDENVLREPLVMTPELFDFTDGAGGGPDSRIDLADAGTVAAAMIAGVGGPPFDYDQNTIINAADYPLWIADILSTCDPNSVSARWPLATALDVNLDRRFNRLDVQALQDALGSTDAFYHPWDYDASGSVTASDVGVLELVRDPDQTGGLGTHAIDHGILGDFDADGTLECDDATQIAAAVTAGNDPFGGWFHTDPLYQTELDVDVDGFVGEADRLTVTLLFNGHDVATSGGGASAMTFDPDGTVDRWDFVKYVSVLSDVPVGTSTGGADWLDRASYSAQGELQCGLPDGAVGPEDLYCFLASAGICGTPRTGPFMFVDFDVDLDGRVNYDDVRTLAAQIQDPLDDPDPKWDLDDSGIVDATDLDRLVWILFRKLSTANRFNHGFVGDYDGSCTPTCNCFGVLESSTNHDLCELPSDPPYDVPACYPVDPLDLAADCGDYAALAALVDTANDPFDGRAYPDAGYHFELDSDLDGDNDSDDRVQIFTMLEPADLDANGALNLDDNDTFATAFLAGDLLADLNGDGVLNLDDIDAFAVAFSNPNCN